jgi:hypothetical protein
MTKNSLLGYLFSSLWPFVQHETIAPNAENSLVAIDDEDDCGPGSEGQFNVRRHAECKTLTAELTRPDSSDLLGSATAHIIDRCAVAEADIGVYNADKVLETAAELIRDNILSFRYP